MKPVRVKTVQVKAGPIKLASAGLAAGHRRSPTRLPAPKSPRPPAPWWQTPAEAQGRSRQGSGPGGHAAAAGRPWHRQRRARRVTGFQACAGPASLARRFGLCGGRRKDYSRRRSSKDGAIKSAAPAFCCPQRMDHPGRGAGERERSPAPTSSMPARSLGRLCSTRPTPSPSPSSPRITKKPFRARFAGLERDQAEAVCRTLKRADISCITVRN